MLHLWTLFDARIDMRVRLRAQALLLRSHRNGRLRTWQKDADPKAAAAVLAAGGAEVAAMEPVRDVPGVEARAARDGRVRDVPRARAVMTNPLERDDRVTRAVEAILGATASPPAQVDQGRPVDPAMIDVAPDRSAPIAVIAKTVIAKTVIAEVFRDRSVATEDSGRVMPPNAPLNSRSMTGLRSPTTLRPRTWTSSRCVAFMVWPTNLWTELPVTS